VSLKAAASDEASEQGSGRYILVRYRSEIAEEFLQSVRFAVLWTVFRNSHQDTFRMCPQYGEFNEICGIEKYIRIFLIWIYPLYL
jgi:hypothetical protein